jgi:hypothetical protein
MHETSLRNLDIFKACESRLPRSAHGAAGQIIAVNMTTSARSPCRVTPLSWRGADRPLDANLYCFVSCLEDSGIVLMHHMIWLVPFAKHSGTREVSDGHVIVCPRDSKLTPGRSWFDVARTTLTTGGTYRRQMTF